VPEALVHRFSEARKAAPCVLYLPRAAAWWAAADDPTHTCFADCLESLPPNLPVLLLAVTEGEVPRELCALFKAQDMGGHQAVQTVGPPSLEARKEFVEVCVCMVGPPRPCGRSFALLSARRDGCLCVCEAARGA
jgi:hypothetical protein